MSDEPTFISRLHERIPVILDELDCEVEQITVACSNDTCGWSVDYTPQNHETTSMLAARMDADVLNHTKKTDGDHIGYDVDIEARQPVQEIDCTITVGDT